MLVDVAAGATQSVALPIIHAPRHDSAVPIVTTNFLDGLIQSFQRRNEITFDRDAAFAVGVAKTGLRIEHQTLEDPAILNDYGRERSGVCRRDFHSVSELQADRRAAYGF